MVKSLISKALALALGGVLLASLPVDAVQSQTPTANTKKASKKPAAKPSAKKAAKKPTPTAKGTAKAAGSANSPGRTN